MNITFRMLDKKDYNKGDSVVNKTFIQMMEALGYDVELTYVKREDGGDL